MKIVPVKNQHNTFNIESLSVGKIMVIKRGLEKLKLFNELGVVGEDLLNVIIKDEDIYAKMIN